MRLNAHYDVEKHEAPHGECVTVKNPRDESRAETDDNQLPGMQVLSHPAECAMILMMDRVNPTVQKSHLKPYTCI